MLFALNEGTALQGIFRYEAICSIQRSLQHISSSVMTSKCHREQELSKPLHQPWNATPPQCLAEAESRSMIYFPDRIGLWAGIPHILSPVDLEILATVPYHSPNGRCPERYSFRNVREAKSSYHFQK